MTFVSDSTWAVTCVQTGSTAAVWAYRSARRSSMIRTSVTTARKPKRTRMRSFTASAVSHMTTSSESSLAERYCLF